MAASVNPQGTPSRAGLTFGPTKSGKTYLSRKDHWNSSHDPQKNKWAPHCPPPKEYLVFCDADEHNWRDSRPHLWGLQANLPVLGTKGERIALFPAPQNERDPWHGYPVSAKDPKREIEHRPERQLVDRWLHESYIDEVDAARINRGRI